MSAFIVSKKTIDAIITGAIDYRMTIPGNLVSSELSRAWKYVEDVRDELGQVLWDENHRSVNYRYSDNEKTPKYTYSRFRDQYVTLPVLIKQLRCLDYQSCETDDWESTNANKIITELTIQAAKNIEGYEDAPWGID